MDGLIDLYTIGFVSMIMFTVGFSVLTLITKES
jgi:hypothetical protein